MGKDPQLNGWLALVRRDCYRAFCKVCDKELIAGLSELKKKTPKIKETPKQRSNCKANLINNSHN